MGFRQIFQLLDQIACGGLRPTVLANVLNDRALAFFGPRPGNSRPTLHSNCPARVLMEERFLSRGRRYAAALSRLSYTVIFLD